MVDILKTMANKHIEFSFLMDETGFMRIKVDKKGRLAFRLIDMDCLLKQENPDRYLESQLAQIIKEVEE
jgi:putative aminopeptidase FrvX